MARCKSYFDISADVMYANFNRAAYEYITVTLPLVLPFYSHYTGQPALAGIPS